MGRVQYDRFLPRDAMLSAVHAVVVYLSVRLSVCVSVTLRYCVTSSSAMAEGPCDALPVEILQLQNIPIVWHYLRHPTFSRFYTIPECDRHTHRNGRTDTPVSYTHLTLPTILRV